MNLACIFGFHKWDGRACLSAEGPVMKATIGTRTVRNAQCVVLTVCVPCGSERTLWELISTRMRCMNACNIILSLCQLMIALGFVLARANC